VLVAQAKMFQPFWVKVLAPPIRVAAVVVELVALTVRAMVRQILVAVDKVVQTILRLILPPMQVSQVLLLLDLKFKT
jgi:hypothetical protein